MTNYPVNDILNALYGGLPETHAVPLEINGELSGETPVEGDEAYALLVSDDLVSFYFTHTDGEPEGSWADATLKPSLVMSKDTQVISVWAFETPEPSADVISILDEHGVSLEDAIPLPGTNGWDAIYLDESALYTAAGVKVALGLEVGVAPPSEDSQPEPAADPIGDLQVMRAVDLADPMFDEKIDFLVGASAQADYWKPNHQDKRWLVAFMSQHRVNPKKDGPAVVYCAVDAEKIGKVGARGHMKPKAGHITREKEYVTGMTAIAIDIDNGTRFAQVHAALMAQPWFAIHYTTHSNGKTETRLERDVVARALQRQGIDIYEGDLSENIRAFYRGQKRERLLDSIIDSMDAGEIKEGAEGREIIVRHDPIEKHRIILILDKPFSVVERGKQSQREAQEAFIPYYNGVCALLGLRQDNTGRDINRLMYTPRHAEGSDWSAHIYGGPMLDLDQIEPVDPETPHGSKKTLELSGPLTAKWAAKHAAGYQMADMISDHAPDRVRGRQGDKVTIECPFDEDHGNPGDPQDKGCFVVNGGEGHGGGAVVHCAHDSCRDRDRVDFFNKMIADQWVDAEVAFDPQYDAMEHPEEDIEEDIEAVLMEFVQQELAKEIAAEPAPYTHPYKLPGKNFGNIHIGKWGGRRCLVQVYKKKQKDGEETLEEIPLCTPFEILSGSVYPDRGGAHDLEVAMEDADGRRRVIRVPASIATKPADLHALLRDQGMGFTYEGKKFLTQVFGWVQPPGKVRFHKPGWRDLGSEKYFLLPSGVVALGDPEKAAVADATRHKVPATVGTPEGYAKGVQAICDSKSISMKASLLLGYLGPVLSLLGETSTVFCYTAKTTHGKSTRQMIGVAVSGSPQVSQGQMRTFNVTSNALEFPLQRASGTILALDEMKGVPIKVVQDTTFLIASETGKGRASADMAEREIYTWSGAVVTMSTEVGVAQRLRQENESQAGGLSVRMVEIYIDEDDRVSKEEYGEIAKIFTNYGWGLPPFVRMLADKGHTVSTEKLRKRAVVIAEGLEGVLEDDTARRAAMPIAYMQLCGELAVEAGLLPASLDPKAVAKSLWERYLSSDMKPEDPSVRGIDNILSYLVKNMGVDVVDRDNDLDGSYREKSAWFMTIDVGGRTSQRVCVVDRDKLTVMAGGAAGQTELLNMLEKRNFLIRRPDPTVKGGRKVWQFVPQLGRGKFVVLDAKLIEGDPDLAGEG